MVGLDRGDAELPDDPVLARLLPDAYRDDPEASGEFRRYTEQGLRSGKAAAARTVLATLPPKGAGSGCPSPRPRPGCGPSTTSGWRSAPAWSVTDDFDDQVADMARRIPAPPYVGVYQWLAYLQETLVQALSRYRGGLRSRSC